MVTVRKHVGRYPVGFISGNQDHFPHGTGRRTE